MWDSICDNWWDKVEAIEHIPDMHVEKRRQAPDAFWKRKRVNWEREVRTRLAEFKAQKERPGRYTIKEIRGLELQPQVCRSGWEKSMNNAIDERRVVDGRVLFDLQRNSGKLRGKTGHTAKSLRYTRRSGSVKLQQREQDEPSSENTRKGRKTGRQHWPITTNVFFG
jgi:hypothetical protein